MPRNIFNDVWEGVLCHIDDVIIFSKYKQEHDNRLHAALRKIQAAGVTLNSDKCEFNKSQLLFLGMEREFLLIPPRHQPF